jgi:hypothetical protein
MASYLELEFKVGGRRQFNDAARALGRVERSIPRDVDKLISKTQKANAKEAAAKVLAQPASGEHGSTGLRKDVAKGVGTMPIDGGTRVYTSMPEENEAIIPLGLDTDKGWRHPVFGNRNEWVTQRGDFSWFMETMKESFKTLPPKVHDILEDGAETIDKAAH